ncbi:MAG: BON domain-containing protein [Verrucomicrobiota bacterium]
MKTLLVLLIGAAIGIAGYIFFRESGKPKFQRAGDKISEGADTVKDKWNDKVGDLDTDRIRDELARTGKVIRKKAEQARVAIADATADARITTEIKSKFAVESDLSALKISVNTTEGVVTLSGTVSSHEAIQKAMQIALAVDGVSQVVSTLQVKP